MTSHHTNKRVTAVPRHGPTQLNLAVLSLRARGIAEKAIAIEFSISERAVRHHLERCRETLDCETTIAAVTLAITSGLITVPVPHARPAELHTSAGRSGAARVVLER